MSADDLSKNKGKVKDIIDKYNNQGKSAVVDLESQDREGSSSPAKSSIQEDSSIIEQESAPKGNKIRLGLKIVNGVAALIAFSLAIASVGGKLFRGDLTGLINIIRSTALIMFRASSLVLPITTLKDKFIKKLESNRVGKVLSDTAGSLWRTLTSKPVKRCYTIGMSALTIVSTPTPIGIASAVVSLTAISYNVIKENLDERAASRLKQEHNLLKQHAKHKQKQTELIKILKSSRSPNLKSFTKAYKTSLGPKRDIQEVRAAVRTSKVAEVLRALRDNTLEAFAAIGRSITGDPVDQAMAAFVTLGNVTGEANKNLQNRKEKFALQKANDKLQMEIIPYKSLEELMVLEKQEWIKTEALERFVKEVQTGGLKQSPQERFGALCKEVEQERAFVAASQESLFTRDKSVMAPDSGFVDKSQSDSVSNSQSPKQIVENIQLQQVRSDKDNTKTTTKGQIKPSTTSSVALPYIKELRSKIRSR